MREKEGGSLGVGQTKWKIESSFRSPFNVLHSVLVCLHFLNNLGYHYVVKINQILRQLCFKNKTLLNYFLEEQKTRQKKIWGCFRTPKFNGASTPLAW